jgi:D-hexose-6-phosphate mutarotase
VPRIWEEWGRSADHAEPQSVTHSTKTVDAHVIGQGLHLKAEAHDFAKEDQFCSESIACANVLETIAGGTPVIPWKSNVAATLTHNFGEPKHGFRAKVSWFFQEHFPSSVVISESQALSTSFHHWLSPLATNSRCRQLEGPANRSLRQSAA